ncbi:succinate dehydrogenase assembly factor 2 [Comamonas aquatica]|uniref:FAD assembly factor SdhE n=1 Tax=Comamonas aquatica TaxID=225991 RepID=A0AA42VZB3_9BURK|nr:MULTISPECIES: succinate dehydrogenase assembly factor 2 [Comamonas]MDH1427845.1 succinate dehydrogenase assembly factor 2 [Comamonas aquatica]MDH1605832.1 succinate dehydrogenase assembly factor 2 [Comamonas aquatica]MDH1616480.1 succinate dehydrogenase assembly factor 2 [Comamonas aquatica]MDH2004370.1 succinate dehydrogenase assembly factor 2 [Comamonas aquatica]MRT21911.1 succinate dehydrogenase assembly factor 2 [Comamonas sp. CAH-2]
MNDMDAILEERERDLLRWRSRRGLVENDLYIEKFFATHGSQLTRRHAIGLSALMDLADNDLMDLFLRRKEPEGALDTPEVREVLQMVRKPI